MRLWIWEKFNGTFFCSNVLRLDAIKKSTHSHRIPLNFIRSHSIHKTNRKSYVEDSSPVTRKKTSTIHLLFDMNWLLLNVYPRICEVNLNLVACTKLQILVYQRKSEIERKREREWEREWVRGKRWAEKVITNAKNNNNNHNSFQLANSNEHCYVAHRPHTNFINNNIIKGYSCTNVFRVHFLCEYMHTRCTAPHHTILHDTALCYMVRYALDNQPDVLVSFTHTLHLKISETKEDRVKRTPTSTVNSGRDNVVLLFSRLSQS